MAKDSPEKKEFDRRFAAAEKARSCIWGDVKEVYYHLLEGSAEDPDLEQRGGELYNSLPEQYASDFTGDLATYFVPEYAEWINFKSGTEIDPDFRREANEMIQQRRTVLMQELASSNLYSAVTPVFKDAVHGTFAMWAHDMTSSQPAYFEPIHISELYVNIGRRGILDDRFRKQKVSWEYLFDTWPELKKMREFKTQQKNAERNVGTLNQGFWIDTKDEASGKWLSRVMVEGVLVDEGSLGSIAEVPLICGRFNPSARKAWGRGPGRALLPDIRALNTVSEMTMDNFERLIDPAFAATNNTIGTDYSQGIMAGTVYDLPPGASLDKIDIGGDPQVGMFTEDRFDKILARGFYQDGPQQRGLTPPSATQWLDEARRIQRRLGKPANPIYDEFITHLIKRTDFILTDKGKLAKAELDGKLIAIEPINPLTYAQRQEQVQVARSLLSDMVTFDPNGFATTVNTGETFAKMKETLGDQIVTIRSEQEIQAEQERQQAQVAQAQGQPQGGPPVAQ